MSSLLTTEGDRNSKKREHNDIAPEQTREVLNNNITAPKKKKKTEYRKQWMKTRKSGTRIGADYQCDIPALLSTEQSEVTAKETS